VACSVAKDVRDRVPRLARGSEHVDVIAICEDCAAALHHSVQRTRHSNLEPLHTAREHTPIRRLDDEVNVVAQDREVNEASIRVLALAAP